MDANRSTYPGNRRSIGAGRKQSGSASTQGNGHRSSVNPRQNSSQHQNNQLPYNGGYRYRFPDQQLLHDKYV